MDRMISCCGLVCSECPALVARRTGDDDLRRRTAADWSKQFGADIRPEHVDCDGCTTPGGVHIPHCHECGIRACAIGRAVPNCGRCGEYPGCQTISGFLAMVPDAGRVLDAERNGSV